MLYQSIFIALILTFVPLTASAEFYKYRDKNGVLRFTDNISEVPEDQRPDVGRYQEADDFLNPFQKAQKKELEKIRREKALTDEAAARKKSEKRRVSVEIKDQSTLDDLKKTKAELDREFAGLMSQKRAIAAKKGLGTPAQIKANNEAVERLNERIAAFEVRRKAFEKRLSDIKSGGAE